MNHVSALEAEVSLRATAVPHGDAIPVGPAHLPGSMPGGGDPKDLGCGDVKVRGRALAHAGGIGPVGLC